MVTENINSMQYHPQDGVHPQRTSTFNRKDFLDDSSDDSRSLRGRGYPNERGRPPEKERYPNSDRRPPSRGGLPSNGRPPDRYGRGPPDGGRSPDDGGPPNGNRGPQDALIEEAPQT